LPFSIRSFEPTHTNQSTPTAARAEQSNGSTVVQLPPAMEERIARTQHGFEWNFK